MKRGTLTAKVAILIPPHTHTLFSFLKAASSLLLKTDSAAVGEKQDLQQARMPFIVPSSFHYQHKQHSLRKISKCQFAYEIQHMQPWEASIFFVCDCSEEDMNLYSESVATILNKGVRFLKFQELWSTHVHRQFKIDLLSFQYSNDSTSLFKR